MSLFSSSRAVLVLGDEGLQVFQVRKRSVKQLAYFPWKTHEFEEALEQVLVKKMGRAPVVVLNDMVEQHYRKEYLLKVGFLERKSVLKRRLGLAFPSYPIRAALKLNEKKQRSTSKPGTPYLFAATPASTAFMKTFNVIRASRSPIVGLYLLPAEGATMVRALSAKLSKKKAFKPVWTIFVGQHHNGGLRQIVTRDGELALTRLTPIVDTDIEPELWAKELSAELSATMSYLARFGYNDADGLRIIIASAENTKEDLQEAVKIESDLTIATPQELSKILDMPVRFQGDARYADPLHALFIGNKKTFSLPLQAPVIEELERPRKMASLALLVLGVCCAYLGYVGFQGGKKSIDLKDKLVIAQQQNQSINAEYNFELDKRKALGFDFLKVNNALEVYETLAKKKAQPLSVIRQVGRSLGADIHLDKLQMAVKSEVKSSGGDFGYTEGGVVDNVEHFLETLVTVSFPGSISPEVSVQRINAIRDRLSNAMPESEVKVIKQVADLSYTGNFTGEASLSESQQVPENYEAEIQIRGSIK